MKNDEFEKLIEQAATTFENSKSYLLDKWEK
jgi:hypothetical protein